MDKIKVAALALIWLSLLSELSLANKTVDVQHKKLDFPDKELIFSYESNADGIDVYAACKIVDKSDERLCKVVREKMDNSRDIQSCDIALKLYNRTEKSNKNNDTLVLLPFGKNDAIFYLAEEGKNASVLFSIINFNNCKISETKISVINPDPHPKHRVIVVPYNDSFDVYFRNPHQCGGNNSFEKYILCKITVNSEGKIINGPIAAIDTNVYQSYFRYIVPICSKSRDKGIFYMKYVNGSLSEYEFVLDKPNGVKKSLGNHNVYFPTRKSTANNLIGVCFKNDPVNSTIKCTQYDVDGNLKFEVEVMSTNETGGMAHVYNLPNGGFLLLAGKCMEKRNCELDEVTFSVIKIDSTGKKVGLFKIGKLKFDSGIKDIKLAPTFHMNKDKKYCISITQFKSTDSGHRNIGYISSTTVCLTDADFTN